MSRFWGVFWVDVSTPTSAEIHYLNIANKLGLPSQDLDEACQGLASIKQPWLLVLDNADDPEVDYQRYFPASPLGVVIMTSRNAECHQYANRGPVMLGGLPESDALTLLLRAAQIPQDQQVSLGDDAQLVCKLLGSHPLALIQAGAYISRGHCSLGDYSKVFDRQRKRLLKFRPSQAQSRYRDVYATFEASAGILQASETETAKDALQLLSILGICGASRLPLPLFRAGYFGAQMMKVKKLWDLNDLKILSPWHVSQLPLFVRPDEDEWDAFRLLEAVSLLKAFSLISTDVQEGSTSVSMHPLTSAWVQDRLDASKQHEAWVSTGCMIVLSFYDSQLWEKNVRQLQPHLEALLSRDIQQIFAAEPPKMIAYILVVCGNELLHGMRDDAKLAQLMSALMKHLNLDPQIPDPDWLPLYSLEGGRLESCGKFPEAVSVFEQIDQVYAQTLAADDPVRLGSQRSLACAYGSNGELRKAIGLLEQAVQLGELTEPKDDPRRLVDRMNLANLYQDDDQIEPCVKILEEVVQIRQKMLPADNRSLLNSQHALARAYFANRQVKESISLFETVIIYESRVLHETHPNLLASQHELARAHLETGQIEEALSLLEKCSRIVEQAQVEDHPLRLTIQHSLAQAYMDNGQTQEAVSLLETVVRIRERSLAQAHPDLLVSQHELARMYLLNNQLEKALALQEKVVEFRRRSLAKDNPTRLTAEQVLASIHWYAGRCEAAYELIKHIAEIERKIWKEDDPRRLNSEHCLQAAEAEISKRKESS